MFAKTFFLLNCSFFRAHSLSLQRRTEETKDKEAEKEKEKIKKLLSEITVGVRNVLSRGSCGKGAATGVPVREHRTQSRLYRFSSAFCCSLKNS